ncbi:MAG: ribonuclease Z [Spirochaetales bacterium]|nr:ribonuclease Z [Spirochaetales bacterium]
MKVKVLGTGAVPSSRRSCGYLIDGRILVDVPNGSWKMMENLGYDLLDIDDILITHFHADHYFDMPFVFLTREGSTDRTLNIFCGESGPRYIYDTLDLAFPDIAQYVRDIPINFNFDDSFMVPDYHVQRFEVIHGSLAECYAYVFEDGKQKIGFSGDTCLCDGLLEAVKGCRHFIMECSQASNTAMKGGKAHLRVDQFLGIAEDNPDCTFYATHMTAFSRNELQERHPRNVVILDDLDELEF